MNTNCLFCNIKNKKVFENEYFFSIFDAHPVSPGHALVIPKTHIVSLFDLSTKQWNALKIAIDKTIDKIINTNFEKLYKKMKNEKHTERSKHYSIKMLEHKMINKKPDGYNIGVNEGESAGRTIHHLHIQIIPRYSGDTKNPTGGIRNIFPKFGNYLKQ